ncbi:uncharacterized protein A4U43_C01F22850 [Asparagus officinalis]|uniref:WRKY domain-containing protein n=1 Tax=Asparagus officinalis TaxID=4686 RepID=A0A5P1FRE7_ASPOF|nr:probable WRKY transcription factor 75 [Asparagus officinalis]ONK80886.1 uncharacterized protein A4U43_C01F22850 [Asparagus officinalis]
MSSYSSLLSSNSSENDKPEDTFEIDDYLTFNEEVQESHLSGPYKPNQLLPVTTDGHADQRSVNVCNRKNKYMEQDTSTGRKWKVAFRTKSEIETMDDGYKWRKYGKKMVKNSPNPRNYYRCLTEGCSVKKRVERARDDSSYVLTTYEGIHNHNVPLQGACSYHAVNSTSQYHSLSSQ